MQAASSQARLLVGIAVALFAVSLWAGWLVITRFGVTRSMSVYDLVALRFGIAGLITLPVIFKQGFALDRLGGPGLVAMIAGAGAPYVLVAGAGLSLAPAVQGGALIPGVMPLWVALLGILFLRERPSPMRGAGLALIAAGALCVVLFEGAVGGDRWVLAGQGLLLLAALMWAGFTLIARRSGLAPLHATAIVSVGSAAFFLPVYFLLLTPTIQNAPWQAIVVQGIYQGLITSLVSLVAWTRAIALLGPSRAAPFAALAPAMASLLAIPLLGEWPTLPELAAVLCVSIGVPLASGLADRRAKSVERLDPRR